MPAAAPLPSSWGRNARSLACPEPIRETAEFSMKPKVYLETSFVSYLSGRLSEDLTTLQRQLSSQRWWEQERSKFDLVVSQIVYDECARGRELAVEGRN